MNSYLYNKKSKKELEKDLAKEDFPRITISFYKYIQLSNLNELRDKVMQMPNNQTEVDNIPETIDVDEEDSALSENSEMENIPEDLEEDAVEGFVGFNSKIHESRIITENF